MQSQMNRQMTTSGRSAVTSNRDASRLAAVGRTGMTMSQCTCDCSAQLRVLDTECPLHGNKHNQGS